jgi:hypothetical protein
VAARCPWTLDDAYVAHSYHILPRRHTPHSYYAEVPATPIDEQSRQVSRLIDLAFDTPGVRHLDVRVIATTSLETGD